MKRKLVGLLVVGITLALVIVGCGSKEENMEPTESNQLEATEPTEDVEPETEIETETEVETEIETETEPEEQYTYTDMSKTMYAKQAVNVRDLPSTDGNKLGGLSKAEEVTITGQCNETNWYRIEYNGSVGYVSDSYLVDEKPAVEQSNGGGSGADSGNSSTSSNNNWHAGYEKYVWYDMGDYFFLITATSDEVDDYCFSEAASGYQTILKERYPDRNAYEWGALDVGGVSVAVVTALHAAPDTGFPMWEEVHHLWD